MALEQMRVQGRKESGQKLLLIRFFAGLEQMDTTGG